MPWDLGRRSDGVPTSQRMPLRGKLCPVPAEILSEIGRERLRAAPIEGLDSRLDAVDALLNRVPDLASIVSASVSAVHALAAEPGYDVSHSQPRWRERIFVSFPERSDAVGALRLAESVVHEAMHLHLTEAEARAPLVADRAGRLWSPWMEASRPARGVLHGVFVFHCIAIFFLRLGEFETSPPDVLRHAWERLARIQLELSKVDAGTLEAALTPCGVARVRSWRAALDAESGT